MIKTRDNEFYFNQFCATIKTFSPKYGVKKILIDKEMLSECMKYRWTVFKNGNSFYAKTYVNKKGLLIHHLIKHKPQKGLVIDHINRDGLDNRSDNLRVLTIGKNILNSRISAKNTTGHKGITICKKTGRYASSIYDNGKKLHLGYYSDIKKAIEAREKAENEIYCNQ